MTDSACLLPWLNLRQKAGSLSEFVDFAPAFFAPVTAGSGVRLRSYVGDRLISIKVFNAVADRKETSGRWTYLFEDGSTRTIISLHPGEPLT
ncbi:hypothetical protein GAY29_14230 [Azospirillum brasilense]|nr:hypothetical protein [Azospirillum brasilense]